MRRILSICFVLGAGAASALASIDSGLIALIPANSKIVAGIDVQKCRTSDFGQYLLTKSQSGDAHFEQFMTETGFDPRRDLESLVMTSSAQDGGKNSSFAILARGSFDEAKIRSAAVGKGAVADSYHGVNLLVNKDHGQNVAFAFPDTGVAVMGDLASVHQVIQNMATAATLDVDLSNRIQSAGTANDAWFVLAAGGVDMGKEFAAHAGGEMNGQSQALQSIRAAQGGVRFGPMVAVTLDAATRSDKDAASLSDVFRFMVSMVQMNRDKDPKAGIIASAMDNMKLNTSGDTMHVEFSLPEKNLEQMADLGPGSKR